MKQPDVFEKMVKKVEHQDECDNFAVFSDVVVKLLRRHHTKIRRLVKAEKVSGETGTEGDIAYNQAIDDILAALDTLAGKKGTR